VKARSLFSRVLLMQVAVALTLSTAFGLVFYVDRNMTIAELLADRWAPALRGAAGLEGGSGPPLAVRRSAGFPAGSVAAPTLAPRIAALRSQLEADGVPVRSVALERKRGLGRTTVWVEVDVAGDRRWIGFDDPRLVEPDAPLRWLLATLGAFAVVALASWHFARRLTRPLADLRTRMETHEPGQAGAEPPLASDAVAEVRAIDAAWRTMNQRLQRHEHERALLLAGVSHDLRSPLTRIRMAAALLPDSAEVAPRRDAIVRSVQAADRLIDDFLDHARFGALVLDQTVDLAEVARRMAADQPALELEAPATLLLPRAHPRLVERLLGNLVDNAFKHGRPPVRMRLAADGGEAVVEVSDGGAGIAEGDREALLRAFARGDASRGTPGSGLGLAIVREGVERLGGRIAFERPAGGGFTVRLLLPLA